MELIVTNPKKLDQSLLDKLSILISEGGQIPHGFEERILKADFVALFLDNENIISTATLKNPNTNYKLSVFKSAKSGKSADLYIKELGYIVTNPKYEGQKLCQQLLDKIMPQISKHNVFATTRKASMAHILSKYGFKEDGQIYKGDLSLFVRDASVLDTLPD